MWLDIRMRLCGWTKSLLVSFVGVCVTLSIRDSDLVVLGLPVLKRRSLGRGDPKLSLLRLWGQSSCLFQLPIIRDPKRLGTTEFPYLYATKSSQKTLRVFCPSPVTFFPEKTNTVDIQLAAQHDPPPLPPHPWILIVKEEIHEALKDTSNKSAPGPSGINYKILKWAYDACPEALTHLFNLSLSTGMHIWKHATIVPVAKPNKPDYSTPKAYRPVSLMECTGKLLEKVITRRITNDIALYPDILPNNQFGSRPQHCTTDAALTLVHRIQASRNSSYHATLVLFDISGFFDHIDANRTCDIFHKKGFPPNMVNWVFSFLTNRSASMRLDSMDIDPFTVPDETPQGSPLSPILSAIYTSFLLSLSSSWSYSSLSLYVDNGAILSISATPYSASHNAMTKLEDTLKWLHANSLMANFEKTELMIFSPARYRGPKVTGTKFVDPTGITHLIKPTTRL